jgi:germination protein M
MRARGMTLPVVGALSALLAAGCGTATTPTAQPTSQPLPTTSAPPTTTTTPTPSSSSVAEANQVRIYLASSKGQLVAAHRVVRTQAGAVLAAAIRELLRGPTSAEREAGVSSAIPAGTEYISADVRGGTATVNLSRQYSSGGGSLSMRLRLGQVVFTASQFPTVHQVKFQLEGQPVTVFSGEGIILDQPNTRSTYEDLVPAIFVESPTIGQTVSSPVQIVGTANVFEAVFKVELTDWDGRIVASRVVTATSGTGTRGDFHITLPYSVTRTGPGELIVSSISPKDGRRINVVETPLTVTP